MATLTQLTFNLHSQVFSFTQFFTNMVDKTYNFIHEVKPTIKSALTQQYFTTNLINTTRLNLLMAQPYEVINVTSSSSGSNGGQDVQKPPDKPNG